MRPHARALTDPRHITGWRAVAHAFLGPSLPEGADRVRLRWEAGPAGARELLLRNESTRRVRLRGLLLTDAARVPAVSGWSAEQRIVVETGRGPRSLRTVVLRRIAPDVIAPGQVLRVVVPVPPDDLSSAVLETREGRQVWTWLAGPDRSPVPLAARTTTSLLDLLSMFRLG